MAHFMPEPVDPPCQDCPHGESEHGDRNGPDVTTWSTRRIVRVDVTCQADGCRCQGFAGTDPS